jgi:hypothetical protein
MKNKLLFLPRGYKIAIACAAVLLIGLLIVALGGGFHTHRFGEWESVRAATCTEIGLQERYCSCGEIQTRETPATGHAFGEWATVKEATCTEDGYSERKCNCGSVETNEIGASGHTEVIDSAKSPTCTSEGLTEGSHCSTCGEVIVAQESVPCLPHNMEDGTCTECGHSADPRKMLTGYVKNNGHVDGVDTYCVSKMFSSPETPSYLFSIYTDFSGSALEFEVFAIYDNGDWVTVSIDVTPGTSKKDVKIHVLYDDDSMFLGEGYIYPETFSGSSHVYNFQYSDSELASDAKKMLIRELDFMLSYINSEMLPSFNLGITLADLGFYQYD